MEQQILQTKTNKKIVKEVLSKEHLPLVLSYRQQGFSYDSIARKLENEHGICSLTGRKLQGCALSKMACENGHRTQKLHRKAPKKLEDYSFLLHMKAILNSDMPQETQKAVIKSIAKSAGICE